MGECITLTLSFTKEASAPADSSALTMSRLPLKAAKKRAVRPSYTHKVKSWLIIDNDCDVAWKDKYKYSLLRPSRRDLLPPQLAAWPRQGGQAEQNSEEQSFHTIDTHKTHYWHLLRFVTLYKNTYPVLLSVICPHRQQHIDYV